MRCPGYHRRPSVASARRGPRSGRIRPSPPRSRSALGRISATWCATRPALQSACAPRGGLLRRPGPHRRYAAQTSDISYGPGGREHLLDIWRRHDLAPGRRAPVLIQVPGGAWAVGGKRVQAYTLMSRMVELGWICVSINYSKSPRCTFPTHLIDVKRAIAWVRENIADYGGDPDFIAITGGSAGGHLASLAALTAERPNVSARLRRRRHHGPGGRAVLRRVRLHRLREHARNDAAVPRAVRDEEPATPTSPSGSRRRRRFPTCTARRRRSSCCTARKTNWSPAARPGPSARRCARPGPPRWPTPNSPMRTTLSTSPRRSDRGWSPTPSPTFWASSTGGAPAQLTESLPLSATSAS